MGKSKAYEGSGVVIHFDPARCIHAEACVHGLPEVFDASRRPWILPGETAADSIVDVVERCPSGALSYERTDGGPQESLEDCEPKVCLAENGPLYVQGHMLVVDHEGERIEVGPRVALCRCGQSRNKPFCDNAHIEAGFKG